MKAENIIVPTDFSASSEAALELATVLARETGAMLHIVHVKQPMTAYKLDSKYGNVPPYPELDVLQGVLERFFPADANVQYRHTLFADDDPAKIILDVAAKQDADYIVMGTHGRTGLSRLLVGSVAEHVIRRATCPVLTLRHRPPDLSSGDANVLPS